MEQAIEILRATIEEKVKKLNLEITNLTNQLIK